MFAKVDVLGLIGAAMMIAGLVCFLTSNLPVWAAYLGGPLLWSFGTVVIIIWIVLRFFPVSSDDSAAMPSAVRSTKTNKSIRAALLIFAGILSAFLLSAEAVDTPTGTDVFKSNCPMCHGTDRSGKTPIGAETQSARPSLC